MKQNARIRGATVMYQYGPLQSTNQTVMTLQRCQAKRFLKFDSSAMGLVSPSWCLPRSRRLNLFVTASIRVRTTSDFANNHGAVALRRTSSSARRSARLRNHMKRRDNSALRHGALATIAAMLPSLCSSASSPTLGRDALCLTFIANLSIDILFRRASRRSGHAKRGA
jgi:hypothetical protein